MVSPFRRKRFGGVDRGKVVADRGYAHGEAINAGEAAGIEPSAAKPLTSAPRTLGLWGTERFTYAPEHDCDRCPAGQALPVRVATVALGRPPRY